MLPTGAGSLVVVTIMPYNEDPKRMFMMSAVSSNISSDDGDHFASPLIDAEHDANKTLTEDTPPLKRRASDWPEQVLAIHNHAVEVATVNGWRDRRLARSSSD